MGKALTAVLSLLIVSSFTLSPAQSKAESIGADSSSNIVYQEWNDSKLLRDTKVCRIADTKVCRREKAWCEPSLFLLFLTFHAPFCTFFCISGEFSLIDYPFDDSAVDLFFILFCTS
jgi:hypothetical protein